MAPPPPPRTPHSHSPYLRYLSVFFSLIGLAFGINAMLNPRSEFDMFEFAYPVLPADQRIVDNFMVVIGIRNVFQGVASGVASYYGDRKIMGTLMFMLGMVAFVDGAVCYAHQGHGHWNHWGYAPMGWIVGLLLIGIMD